MQRSFRDMLHSPLPSKRNSIYDNNYYEAATDNDEVTVADIEDGSGDNFTNEPKTSGPVELDDEASQRVDDTIKRVATPIIIEDMLNDDEIAVLKESIDADILCTESYLNERTIVKLDKGAKRKQLIKVASLTIAKEKKDPLYKKLMTVWKMERALEAKIYAKYEAQSKQRANKYLKNAKNSKSPLLKKAVSKITKK